MPSYDLLYKKIAVLLHPENSFWKNLYPEEEANVSTTCKDYLGFKIQTLDNWKKGDIPNQISIKKLSDSINNSSEKNINNNIRVTPEYFEDGFDIYNFGKIFDLTITECQMVVDKISYRYKPPVSGIYEEKKLANKFFRDYGGVYCTYHYTKLRNGNIYLFRSALRVRYVLEVDRKRYLLRCKMHVPSLRDKEKGRYYDYDGFFIFENQNNNNIISFFLEERKSERSDCITISVYKEESNNEPLNLFGFYLSKNQDVYPAMYNTRIVLTRILIPKETNEKEIRGKMSNIPKVIDKAEKKDIDEKILRFLEEEEVSLLAP